MLLSEYFRSHYSTNYHKTIEGFESDAIQKLRQYHLPGNVRELQYSIERAVIMSEHSGLRAADLLFSPIESAPPIENPMADQPRNLEELERKAIQQAMDRYSGNISKAARELGLTRAALYRRMEKYGI